MDKIQHVTGMLDVLPDDRRYWDWIIDTASDLAQRYGYSRLDVPVVENKPVARMLFKVVEIGDMIPYDMYKTVAEILAIVYKMKGGMKHSMMSGKR